MKKIFKLAYKTEKSFFFIMIFKALLQAFIVLFNSFYISYILDLVIDKSFNDIIINIIFLILLDIMTNILLRYLNKFIEYELISLNNGIYKEALLHMTYVSYKNIETSHYQELIQNIKYGVRNMSSIYSIFDSICDLVTRIITIISITTSLIVLSPYVVLIVLVCFILSLIIYILTYKFNIRFFLRLVPINRKYGYYTDTLLLPNYQKDLRLNNLDGLMLQQYDKFSDTTVEEITKFSFKTAVLKVVNAILNYLELGAIYILVAYQTIVNDLMVSVFTLNVSLATNLYTNLNQITSDVVEYNRYYNYLKPLIEALGLEKVDYNKGVKLSDFQKIEFRNVSFKYPNSEKLVLDNVSFVINKGDKIALVGLNGAGKSTIVKLICRLYDVSSGEILVNDRNILEYSLDSYYDVISAVFQDYKIFAVSIEDNILIDKQKDINKIINELGLDKVIDKLPHKIKTMYSKEYNKDGVLLSGGETQKIAIARALAKESQFLLLDEPTSALDPIAEADIYANFKELAINRTAIYISHRLASAIFCDKILVLDDGKIKDFDTHEDLMKKNSMYSRLFNLQKENYKLN